MRPGKLSLPGISRRIARALARWDRHLTPPRLLAGSFLLLILVGAAGFLLLPGLYTGEPLGPLDSLFTSASAVCVTGLVVADTATRFTPFGQAYLLLLIQLGGLGIITLSSMIILALGGRLSLSHQAAAAAGSEVAPRIEFKHLIRNVVVFTLFFEAAGALLLSLLWAGRFEGTDAVRHAIFHAVSAFCNAGFSSFSTSLSPFREDPAPLLIVAALILVGGIGFLTMEDLSLRARAGRHRETSRLSLNTRLVVLATLVLVLGGSALFTLFEWDIAFRGFPAWAKPLNGFFMSVTARTAGFNTIDYFRASDSSILLTMILMFIGGSPGSTAGGVKTTTAGLLALLLLSRLRGSRITNFHHRTIPDETIHRAVLLSVVAVALLASAVFVLTATEVGPVDHAAARGSLTQFAFEAISAFNTVGLSIGETASLSSAGKAVVIFLMYVGRIGPLSLASAVALRRKGTEAPFRFAYEDVAVG
ncbi:MAG: potassium transporter TrkH [Candidatus Eisenbacteria bacterium]|nr:potassium transporter TrkH [Candidatus Eisenbacteria bacterium]